MTEQRTSPMERRAKIIATMGPATQSPDAVRALVDAGMDVARLNFSHGTWDQHAAAYARVREASDAAGRAVAVLADLQGPKVRFGRFDGGFAVLEAGAAFTLSSEPWPELTQPRPGSTQHGSTSYEALAGDLVAGDTLLVDDGMVKLCALSSDGREVQCRVVDGGVVSDHKGINLPGVRVSAPCLTPKDIEDLKFALALGVDLVALSFVRWPEDAKAVRTVMEGAGRRVPVIAKLERREAVENLEAIVDAFDGVMVARGDLGVETALEQVPLVQKRAVQLARERGKPVIVATQMLESMIHHPRPTRAEVSDVANAVLDGADALMLSAETSIGNHAVEAVATMGRIAAAAEGDELANTPPLLSPPSTSQDVLSSAAPSVGAGVRARAMVGFTQTGATARRLASHRSSIPLLAFTPDPAVRSRLALTWGVETFIVPLARHSDEMVAQVERAMLELGRCRPGDRVVIVAGTQPGRTGSTDMVRIHQVGPGQSVPSI